MKNRPQKIATIIVGLTATIFVVSYFVARQTPAAPVPDTEFLTPAQIEALAEAPAPPDPRPAPDSFRLLDPHAAMLRVPGARAVTTKRNGIDSWGTFQWRNFGSVEMEATTTFTPKLATVHVYNPVPDKSTLTFQLSQLRPDDSKIPLGIRTVTGRQFESFVIQSDRPGLHRFEFAYTAANPPAGRPALTIRDLILSE